MLIVRTLAALPLILGERHKDDANYLDTCRTKRNTAEYDRAGVTTEEDAGELIAYCRIRDRRRHRRIDPAGERADRLSIPDFRPYLLDRRLHN